MTERLRRLLKEGVFGTLYLLVQGRDRGLRAILLYHSVEKIIFLKQMFYLKDKFRFILLRDLKDELLKDNDGENLICCTFDDGELNNYTVALPILQALRIKATFFITSGFVGKHIHDASGERPMMGAQHLRELVSLGHETGAHTVSHPILTRLSLDGAREEIVRSKFFLEDVTGSPVVSFAYPKGTFNSAVRNLVEEAGFHYCVTIREALLTDGNIDWLELPRIGIDPTVRMVQFRGKVSPALELYETLRGRRKK